MIFIVLSHTDKIHYEKMLQMNHVIRLNVYIYILYIFATLMLIIGIIHY